MKRATPIPEELFRIARVKERIVDRGLDLFLRETAGDHHVLVDEILSRSRQKAIVGARRAFMLFLHDTKRFSWPQISELFEMSITAHAHVRVRRRDVESRVVNSIARFLRKQGQSALAEDVEKGAWKGPLRTSEG